MTFDWEDWITRNDTEDERSMERVVYVTDLREVLTQVEESKQALAERILDVVQDHHTHIGVSASPDHWAYIARKDGKGQWYATCTRHGEAKGCGWDSEPDTFYLRRQALEAAASHVRDKIMEVLT